MNLYMLVEQIAHPDYESRRMQQARDELMALLGTHGEFPARDQRKIEETVKECRSVITLAQEGVSSGKFYQRAWNCRLDLIHTILTPFKRIADTISRKENPTMTIRARSILHELEQIMQESLKPLEILSQQIKDVWLNQLEEVTSRR